MGKARYEGYFEGTPTKLVKETFGDAKIYTQKKGIRVETSQDRFQAFSYVELSLEIEDQEICEGICLKESCFGTII
jgi:hypothetical protein